MQKKKIDMFFMSNRDCFSTQQQAMIREQLEQESDDQYYAICSQNYRSCTTMLILSVVLGDMGIDRFMLGETGMGVLKLLTGGGCGIWWMIDLFIIKERTQDYNFNLFNEALMVGHMNDKCQKSDPDESTEYEVLTGEE